MPLAKPRAGEKQNAFVSRCISQLDDENSSLSQDQRVAACFSQFRKVKGGSPGSSHGSKHKEKANWHDLKFSTPITESAFINDDFIIRGVAISETTTHNNHRYIAEELSKAAPGLMGKPLLVDHDNRVESIKGKVTSSFFDDIKKNIQFEAKIMDKDIKDMIKDGRISNVSIGAFAEDLVKEEDSDSFIAKGIKIVELSLVAIPADENATFATAMAKNFQLKESMEDGESYIYEDSFKEEIDKIEKAEKNIYTGERRYGEMAEEKKDKIVEKNQELEDQNKKITEELKALKQEKKDALITKYKVLCEEKKIKEKDVSNLTEETIKLLTEQLEEIKVEKKELKSVVTMEIPKEIDNFIVSNEPGVDIGTAVWEMPNVDEWRRNHKNWDFAVKIDGR